MGQIGSCGGAKAVALALFAVNGGAETFLTKKQKKSIIETTGRIQETKCKTRDDTKRKRKDKIKARIRHRHQHPSSPTRS